MGITHKELPEQRVEGKPLGRHIAHDDESWNYPANVADKIVTTIHTTHDLPLDQGNLGSCTGNAMTGLLMTDPFFKANRILTETDAVAIYSLGTHLDRIRGVYPPNDTGCSGLAVAKAAKEKGYISEYRHAFGLDHALKALVLAPVIIGIAWYDSFDQPHNDIISISPNASVRGGHEVLVNGVDAENQRIVITNSWGPGWGKDGVVEMSWTDFDRLLHEQGDVTTVTP